MDPQLINQSPQQEASAENPLPTRKISWAHVTTITGLCIAFLICGIFLGRLFATSSKPETSSPNITNVKTTKPTLTLVPQIEPKITLIPQEKGVIDQVTLKGSDLFSVTKTNELVESLEAPGVTYVFLSIRLDPSIKPLCDKCTISIAPTSRLNSLKEQVQTCTTSQDCTLVDYGASSCPAIISLKTTAADSIASTPSDYFRVNKYSMQLPECGGVGSAPPVASTCISDRCQGVYQ